MLSKSKHTYIAKAIWHSTSKSFRIEARDDAEAYIKASRSKEAKGCSKVTVQQVE